MGLIESFEQAAKFDRADGIRSSISTIGVDSGRTAGDTVGWVDEAEYGGIVSD